ncbi:MAG: ATP synthase F1 subunit delta [Calditrichaeota bacterium]|nr:ATP synthase F1 subunit delta [Calditrichota bacterium]
MVITSTARRYARAFFEIACERDQTDQLLAQLDAFTDEVENNAELKKLLRMPNHSKKLQLIDNLVRNLHGGLLADFVNLLVKNNRSNLLPQIREDFHSQYDKKHSLVRATVITAVPLPADAEDQLKVRLERFFDAHLQIHNQIDPAIIGGFIVKVDGQVFDASVLDKFKKMKMYLTQN